MKTIIDEQELTILSQKEFVPNFNHFNQIQNRYMSDVNDIEKIPEKLIELAWEEFKEFCGELHINSSMYFNVEVSVKYGVWQVDFVPEFSTSRRVSVFNIYLNEKENKIIQCQVEAS